MIEKITHKKKLLAIIIRKKYRKKNGINFFTPNNLNLQCGFMKHKKNYIIKPHLHLKRFNKIFYTSETLILLKGKLRIDFQLRLKMNWKAEAGPMAVILPK